MPKFGTKNALFGYFWAGTRKHYCHILNQQSRICLIETFYEIIKMRKFVTKNALLVHFWARFYKFVVIFEINTLTIRSSFSKVRGLLFLKVRVRVQVRVRFINYAVFHWKCTFLRLEHFVLLCNFPINSVLLVVVRM